MAQREDTKITVLAFQLTGMLIVALVVAASLDISQVTYSLAQYYDRSL